MLLAATAISPSAWADTTTYAINQPKIEIATGMSSAFNQATCETGTGGTAVAYSFPSSFTEGYVKLSIFVTESNTCSDSPGSSDLVLLQQTTINSANQSDTLTLVGRDLVDDCPANEEKAFRVCAVSTVTQVDAYGTQSDKAQYHEYVLVTYDSVQPETPVIKTASAGDSAVTFTWASQGGIDHWVIYYWPDGEAPVGDAGVCGSIVSSSSSALQQCWWSAGADACVITDCDDTDANCFVPPDASVPPDAAAPFDAAEVFNPKGVADGGTAGSVTIPDGDNAVATGRVGGLVNDQNYTFLLVAVDLAGNESGPSKRVDAMPLVVHDFYRRYQCAGGNEKGGFGCSTAGVAVLLPAAGLALFALVRRRRAS